MNKLTLISFAVLLSSLLFSFNTSASVLTGCAAKRADIENQLQYAREHNNSHQITRLQMALDKNKANCTDAELLQERQNKVAEKQRKVSEREQELAIAGETGDQKKIKQKQKKLAQAKEELAEAQEK
ncbi:DUF1090 domain-containing protein [Salmonella enterica subsp. enterica serovar Newport]|uniref:DUF1090 domain-containing protein n=1 Tax=Salmonella newport TaxID=108619 RepID=A0A5U9KZ73_SALNE|nr:DUF1090 domain-containing protein [Salmonella enterica]EAW1164904.1 DUF1090 domain-containing protein [Salmonella enterica subsp. enterica]EBS2696545.1 DUF1090 domain-containing protein [Salmonella enterica subsp. enterica serovar Newport]EBK5908675.1 DUF1090 domain-containing protein [Salmonella enterica]ECN8543094.1 DUF1090 domain-containing protein [Salmonella enterica subsp. enterica serovar Newport]